MSMATKQSESRYWRLTSNLSLMLTPLATMISVAILCSCGPPSTPLKTFAVGPGGKTVYLSYGSKILRVDSEGDILAGSYVAPQGARIGMIALNSKGELAVTEWHDDGPRIVIFDSSLRTQSPLRVKGALSVVGWLSHDMLRCKYLPVDQYRPRGSKTFGWACATVDTNANRLGEIDPNDCEEYVRIGSRRYAIVADPPDSVDYIVAELVDGIRRPVTPKSGYLFEIKAGVDEEAIYALRDDASRSDFDLVRIDPRNGSERVVLSRSEIRSLASRE